MRTDFACKIISKGKDIEMLKTYTPRSTTQNGLSSCACCSCLAEIPVFPLSWRSLIFNSIIKPAPPYLNFFSDAIKALT